MCCFFGQPNWRTEPTWWWNWGESFLIGWKGTDMLICSTCVIVKFTWSPRRRFTWIGNSQWNYPKTLVLFCRDLENTLVQNICTPIVTDFLCGINFIRSYDQPPREYKICAYWIERIGIDHWIQDKKTYPLSHYSILFLKAFHVVRRWRKRRHIKVL